MQCWDRVVMEGKMRYNDGLRKAKAIGKGHQVNGEHRTVVNNRFWIRYNFNRSLKLSH